MNKKNFTWYSGYSLILMLWIGSAAISAIFFSLASGSSFGRGLFESVSALTLTNASLIGDSAPLGLKLFRTVLQLPGSVLFTVLNTYSFILITGSMRTTGNRITIGASSRHTWNTFSKIFKLTLIIHILIFTAGFILILPAVHSLYKTFVYAVSAMTTGGFLPFQIDGITYLQIILSILMLTGVYQFLAMNTIISRHGKRFLFNSEYKLFAVLFLSLGAIHLITGKQGLGESILKTTALMTGTGILNISSGSSPIVQWQIAILVFGSLACSPSGGIKLYRLIIFYKTVMTRIRQTIFSESVIATSINIDRRKRILEPNVARHSLVYIFLFLVLFFGLALLSPPVTSYRFTLAFLNYGGNIDWASMSSGEVILDITGMILGRFAIYPLSFIVFHDIKRRNPS